MVKFALIAIFLLSPLRFIQSQSANFVGTWGDEYSTLTISGSPAYYTATFSYQVKDSKGEGGQWDSVNVDGNTITGKWTVQHEDDTKSGSRQGTFRAVLDGEVLSGVYLETVEPNWNYKPGFSRENVVSSMGAGKEFAFSYKRKTSE